MKVDYLGGAWSVDQLPVTGLPEVAVIGRSNVGKSTLINALLRRRQMARVSSTPGRTQALHFFAVADALCLVDLPGYGFAKVPQAVKQGFLPLVEGYLDRREGLQAVLVLVDARREPGAEERALVARVQARGVRVLLVVTKTDKLAKTRRGGRVQQLAAALGVPQADAMGFSGLSGEGRDALFTRLMREATRR